MARIAAAIEGIRVEEPERRFRRFQQRRNDIDTLTDDEFQARLRLNKHCYRQLYTIIEPDITPEIPTNHAISAHTRLQMALRFLATGSIYRINSDLYGISNASTSRHLFKVVDAITSRIDQFIYMPPDLAETKRKFFYINGMPDVIGAIDGTHVAVTGLKKDVEMAYVNRKSFHSINVQAICDADRVFTNVVARWPGSSHDNTIFQASAVFQQLSEGQIQYNNCYLLGDSGYGAQTFLLTPFIGEGRTPAQARYNRSHKGTRVVIERAFGELKARFRCLGRQGGALYFTPEKCCKVISACFCLHNLCKRNGVDIPEGEVVEQIQAENIIPEVNIPGLAARQRFVEDHFGDRLEE